MQFLFELKSKAGIILPAAGRTVQVSDKTTCTLVASGGTSGGSSVQQAGIHKRCVRHLRHPLKDFLITVRPVIDNSRSTKNPLSTMKLGGSSPKHHEQYDQAVVSSHMAAVSPDTNPVTDARERAAHPVVSCSQESNPLSQANFPSQSCTRSGNTITSSAMAVAAASPGPRTASAQSRVAAPMLGDPKPSSEVPASSPFWRRTLLAQ